MNSSIQRLTKGNPEVVRSVNNLIANSNALAKMTGDDIISVSKSSNSISISLNLNTLRGRLANSVGTSGSSVQYAYISQAISYTGFSYYKVVLINDDTAQTEPTGTEIIVDHILSESGVVDFREYFPWFLENDVVRVYQSNVDVDEEWYIDETFSFIDSGANNSIAVEEATKRIKAVWV